MLRDHLPRGASSAARAAPRTRRGSCAAGRHPRLDGPHQASRSAIRSISSRSSPSGTSRPATATSSRSPGAGATSSDPSLRLQVQEPRGRRAGAAPRGRAARPARLAAIAARARSLDPAHQRLRHHQAILARPPPSPRGSRAAGSALRAAGRRRRSSHPLQPGRAPPWPPVRRRTRAAPPAARHPWPRAGWCRAVGFSRQAPTSAPSSVRWVHSPSSSSRAARPASRVAPGQDRRGLLADVPAVGPRPGCRRAGARRGPPAAAGRARPPAPRTDRPARTVRRPAPPPRWRGGAPAAAYPRSPAAGDPLHRGRRPSSPGSSSAATREVIERVLGLPGAVVEEADALVGPDVMRRQPEHRVPLVEARWRSRAGRRASARRGRARRAGADTGSARRRATLSAASSCPRCRSASPSRRKTRLDGIRGVLRRERADVVSHATP